MGDEKPDGYDLWGNPIWRDRAKRGRPAFRWSEENSRKINMMLAVGWTNTRIASVIRDPRTGKPISVPTLKRYFRAELNQRDVATDQMTLRRLERIWAQAEKGNIGAERLFHQVLMDEMRGSAIRRPVQDEIEDEADDLPARPLASGKKAARADAAQMAFEADAHLGGAVTRTRQH